MPETLPPPPDNGEDNVPTGEPLELHLEDAGLNTRLTQREVDEHARESREADERELEAANRELQLAFVPESDPEKENEPAKTRTEKGSRSNKEGLADSEAVGEGDREIPKAPERKSFEKLKKGLDDQEKKLAQLIKDSRTKDAGMNNKGLEEKAKKTEEQRIEMMQEIAKNGKEILPQLKQELIEGGFEWDEGKTWIENFRIYRENHKQQSERTKEIDRLERIIKEQEENEQISNPNVLARRRREQESRFEHEQLIKDHPEKSLLNKLKVGAVMTAWLVFPFAWGILKSAVEGFFAGFKGGFKAGIGIAKKNVEKLWKFEKRHKDHH